MKKIILAVLLFFVACIIFYNSAKTAEVSSALSGSVIDWFLNYFGIELSQFTVRKLAHFCEFALLGGLLYACGTWIWKSTVVRLIVALVVGGIYAATDEFHQIFVAGRSCEFRDWCIDFCGITFGVGVAWIIGKFQTEKKKGGF